VVRQGWQLSGGEQQRVAIARAFACQPSVLFADEPTGNLDRNTGKTIIDLLFELNQQNQTSLVLVTHDEHLAQRCQRSIHIHDGTIVNEGMGPAAKDESRESAQGVDA
jgi:putative ABC transport system ATP-binding protein